MAFIQVVIPKIKNSIAIIETEITVFLVDKDEESTVSIFGITCMINWLNILNLTPLLISPHGGKEYNSFHSGKMLCLVLLPPWGKVGMGVQLII